MEIRYFYINLDRASDRRASAERQAARFGITMERIEAVKGSDLTPDDLKRYDRQGGKKYYTKELLPNECACIESHRKALRVFLKSGADYGVILEDDFELSPDFNEGIAWLTQQTKGWEMCKLWSGYGKLYPLHRPINGKFNLVLPRKKCVSLAYIYTARGAKRILECFKTYRFPFDSQLAWYYTMHDIPMCAISPSIVTVSSLGFNSTIGGNGNIGTDERLKGIEARSFAVYLRHRFAVSRYAWKRLLQIRKMKKRIRINQHTSTPF